MRSDSLVLNEENAPDWPKVREHGAKYTKFVVGSLTKGTKRNVQLPDDLATVFPNLTHLHVWGWSDLTALPQLPPGLVSLDIRKCPNLKSVTNLPSEHLEELVIEDARELTTLPLAATYPNLWDVSIQNCPLLEEPALLGIIDKATEITHLNYSGCSKLRKLTAFPVLAERVDLNRMESLSSLPEFAPSTLRRLGLRDSAKVRGLPEFSDWPDYLDLAGAASIRSLGPTPVGGRTLFLFGSGVTKPPAIEHGRSPDENVSEATRRYFSQLKLVGPGQVNRAKILMLGNGRAGKTCLSLALLPQGNPKDAADLGSTHGVQFHSYEQHIEIDGRQRPIDVQIWDFGGQEIYHQTHRLFMSRGSIFVVLWDPGQDGLSSQETKGEYRDILRPLSYWLELIELASPGNTSVCVVCSVRTKEKPDVRERYLHALGDRDPQRFPLFCIDSETRRHDFLKFKEDWVATAIGNVIASEGSHVPIHWELAQQMVVEWLRQSQAPTKVQSHPDKDLELDEFASRFRHYITARMEEKDPRDRLGLLRKATGDKSFPILETGSAAGLALVTQTLEFLTRAGWVFWDHNLFERKVVIGQKWALDGIYATLDRREGKPIFDKLRAAGGRFFPENLDEWIDRADWKDKYTPPQKNLLLSYMCAVGVCIRLDHPDQRTWRAPEYLCLQHLKSMEDLYLADEYGHGSTPHTETIESDRLHISHWHFILKQLGETYGSSAKYARNGFAIKNREQQSILVSVNIDPMDGIGGKIRIKVCGPDSQARCKEVSDFVRRSLPRLQSPGLQGGGRNPAGTGDNRLKVFVSYAWKPNEKQKGWVDEDTAEEYELPAKTIAAHFHEAHQQVHLDWDKRKPEETTKDIAYFMRHIDSADRIVVVLSKKYWRSPFCMCELGRAYDRVKDATSFTREDLLFVLLSDSGLRSENALEEHAVFWEGLSDIDPILTGSTLGMDVKKLKAAAIQLLRWESSKIAAGSKYRFEWIPRDPQSLIPWLEGSLGLNPKTPKE